MVERRQREEVLKCNGTESIVPTYLSGVLTLSVSLSFHPPSLSPSLSSAPHPSSSFCFLHPLLSHQALGQVGKVLKVYADGDLRVAFNGQTWTFNPACLSAQSVEVDANLMTAENPNVSGSKDY